jgi:hypothetical protein
MANFEEAWRQLDMQIRSADGVSLPHRSRLVLQHFALFAQLPTTRRQTPGPRSNANIHPYRLCGLTVMRHVKLITVSRSAYLKSILLDSRM